MLPYSNNLKIEIEPTPISYTELAIGETFCFDTSIIDLDLTREESARAFYNYSIATKLNETKAVYNHGVTTNIEEVIAQHIGHIKYMNQLCGPDRSQPVNDLMFHRVTVRIVLNKEQFKRDLNYWLHEISKPKAQELLNSARAASPSAFDRWLDASYFLGVASGKDARQIVSEFCEGD